MTQVSSSTCLRKNGAGRTGIMAAIGLLVVALACGIAVPASADSLTEERQQLRRAIAAAKERISAGEDEVDAAASKLAAAQQRLNVARDNLATVTSELRVARTRSAEITKIALAAKARVSAANAAVATGESRVAAHLSLMGDAARTAYQQRSGLVGYSVVLGSESLAEVAQRMQWSPTVLDTTAGQLDRLRELQGQLEAARAEQVRRQAEAVRDQAESDRQLAKAASLARSANAATADVARLVRDKAAEKAAAKHELEQDRASYRKLQAEDRKVGAEIKRRAEIARKKLLAEQARKRAAAKKAGKKYVAPSPSTKGFIYPVNARPGSPFGLRYHPILHYWRMHRGQDFGAPCGAPLYAVADGRVASARWQGGFGNYTVLDVGFIKGQYVSVGYAHQSKMIVRAGQRVTQGQVIGYVGTTGLSTGCHLHFQVYVNGGVVDPMTYL